MSPYKDLAEIAAALRICITSAGTTPLLQKTLHQLGDPITFLFQREVTGIEKMNFRFWKLHALRNSIGIYLAPFEPWHWPVRASFACRETPAKH
jgi:hypothetical protein